MIFDDATYAAFSRAREVALELGQGRIAPLHVAVAVLEMPDPLTADVLGALRADAGALAAALRGAAPAGRYEVGVHGGPDLAYSEAGVRVLHGCRDEAAALGHRVVHPLHLLLAVLADPTARAGRELTRAGVGRDALRGAFAAEVP